MKVLEKDANYLPKKILLEIEIEVKVEVFPARRGNGNSQCRISGGGRETRNSFPANSLDEGVTTALRQLEKELAGKISVLRREATPMEFDDITPVGISGEPVRFDPTQYHLAPDRPTVTNRTPINAASYTIDPASVNWDALLEAEELAEARRLRERERSAREAVNRAFDAAVDTMPPAGRPILRRPITGASISATQIDDLNTVRDPAFVDRVITQIENNAPLSPEEVMELEAIINGEEPPF